MSVQTSKFCRHGWVLSGQLVPEEPSRTIPINVQPFTIGRRTDCALPLSSLTVSNQHAELTLVEGRLAVLDLGSTNGTFVNGARIEGLTVLHSGDLLQFAEMVFRVRSGSEANEARTLEGDASDRALSLIQFEKLLTNDGLIPHYQSIVEVESLRVAGCEVLGRSRLFGLQMPKAMFAAASVLNLEAELSRLMRLEGARAAADLQASRTLFLNTHPAEMADLSVLLFSLREARELADDRPLVLEIHEGSLTCVKQMRELRDALDDLEIGLAYDDFGAGQARLVELVEVPPDYLKFDISLVRKIDQASSERRRMLDSLVRIVRDLGIAALAEGVETAGEHEACRDAGFNFAQGFFYGRPVTAGLFEEASRRSAGPLSPSTTC
jgi:EAL domain-containing protein (putative c-di-GMP-specific phosphodiesterase class I)